MPTRIPTSFLLLMFVASCSDATANTREPLQGVLEYEDSILGLEVGGFESMCGIPLCLVPTELSAYFNLSDIPEGFDRGEFVKTPACQACDLRNKCYGLRRGYLALHGDDELRPVRAEASGAAAHSS